MKKKSTVDQKNPGKKKQRSQILEKIKRKKKDRKIMQHHYPNKLMQYTL